MSSGTVIVRRLAAVPERTASQTWLAVVNLIAQPGTAAHDTLVRASGVASMLIAEAYTADAPIVVTPGAGSRVRIYTVHGAGVDDALSEELPLSTWPASDSGWALSLPCGAHDLQFATQALADIPEITVRDAALGIDLDQRQLSATATTAASLRVDTRWLED